MRTIYKPEGKAGEYSELALNPYEGCAHRCVYCYAPNATFKKRETFHSNEYVKPRPGFLEALKKTAPNYSGCSTPILLSFATDPYQPIERKLGITRQALEILAANNCPFTILTKGGSWGLIRDLDLIKSNPLNEWAVTLTHDDPQVSQLWEPGAALPEDRKESLKIAHEAGIKTWVSLEPVIDPEAVYRLVYETHPYVDLYKVGKINYHPRAKEIDWAEFREKIEKLLKSLNKNYYIKNDLRSYEMSKKQNDDTPRPAKKAVKVRARCTGKATKEAIEAKGQEPLALRMFGTEEMLSIKMPERMDVFPGVITTGLNMLAGKPKMGKSWLCLNLACSIAHGFQFLRQTVTPQCLLYYALEDTPRRIQERLSAIMPKDFKPEGGNINFVFSSRRIGQGGLRDLEGTLKANRNIRVVIIDTWAKIRGITRTGSSQYEKDYNEITRLKAIADTYCVAIVLVHHMRKTTAKDNFDMVIGSNGSTGASDNIILLTKDTRGTDAVLKIHSRDMEDQDIALRFDNDSKWWTVLGKPAAEYQISQERQEILDFLKEENEEPVKLGSIATFLGKKKPNVYNLLKKLVKQGLVEKVGFGKYQLKTVEKETVETECANPKSRGNSCLTLVPKIDGAKGEAKKSVKINFHRRKRSKVEKTEAHKKVEAINGNSNEGMVLWS